jgi:hypothetical protein
LREPGCGQKAQTEYEHQQYCYWFFHKLYGWWSRFIWTINSY